MNGCLRGRMELRIRAFTSEDVTNLARIANSIKISDNLRDGFPNPYTEEDARRFIDKACLDDPISIFAIEWKGQHVGNIGLHPLDDIYSKTAELGYFVGEEFWGNGIATQAVNLIVEYGFNTMELNRIEAGIFEHNTASMHVLEKNGFQKEGVARKVAVKNDVVIDEHRYALVHPRFRQR